MTERFDDPDNAAWANTDFPDANHIMQELGNYEYDRLSGLLANLGLSVDKSYILGMYLDEGWYRAAFIPWNIRLPDQTTTEGDRIIINHDKEDKMTIDDYTVCFTKHSILYIGSEVTAAGKGSGRQWKFDHNTGPIISPSVDHAGLGYGKTYNNECFAKGTLKSANLLAVQGLYASLKLFSPSCIESLGKLHQYYF